MGLSGTVIRISTCRCTAGMLWMEPMLSRVGVVRVAVQVEPGHHLPGSRAHLVDAIWSCPRFTPSSVTGCRPVRPVQLAWWMRNSPEDPPAPRRVPDICNIRGGMPPLRGG
jgi:hypothetical protein